MVIERPFGARSLWLRPSASKVVRSPTLCDSEIVVKGPVGDFAAWISAVKPGVSETTVSCVSATLRCASRTSPTPVPVPT